MGYLARRVRADAGWNPADDRWYMPWLGLESDAGIEVGPDTLEACGAVWGAVRFRAKMSSLCTPQVLLWIDKRSRQDAPDHPVQAVLDDPNAWQTYIEWMDLNVHRLSLWGDSYNEILGGGRSFVEQLRPMLPGTVRPIDQLGDGQLVYEHRPLRGEPRRMSQSELLHFRGPGSSSYSGARMYQIIRNACGIAIAAEKHASVFLRKGTRLSGILSTKNDLPDIVRTKAQESWVKAFGGPDNEGKVAMVGGGLEFKPVTTDHRNAQFLELRDFQIGEMLRFLEVPGVVVGYAEKTATYASAKEFFEQGGLTLCIQPLVMRLQQRMQKDLFVRADPHYLRLNMRALRRINTRDQYDAYQKAIQSGWMNRNEARAFEDMDAGPPELDEFLEPQNMRQAGDEDTEQATAPTRARSTPEPDDENDEKAKRLEKLAVNGAVRVIRRQVGALQGGTGIGAVKRYADNAAGWATWVKKFRDEQAAIIEREIGVKSEQARAFVAHQTLALLVNSEVNAGAWEQAWYPALEAMALGEPWEELLNEEPAA